VYRGGHLANPRIQTRRAARVRVEAGAPLTAQLDGELGAHTPLDIEICPGALRLLV
jgi:diacylglycerol kinase family enzyme